jgi:hypothetical protein
MKLRWIYLGLVVALTATAFVLRMMGSAEVGGHALFHLTFSATILAVMWFIPRPVSTPNLWLWRGGWALSAAWWVEALGAFGYDDRATSAVPGLYTVHTLSGLLVLAALLVVIASAIAVAWTRLPRVVGVALAILVAGGTVFMISVAMGFAP